MSDHTIEIVEIKGFGIFGDSRDEMLLGKLTPIAPNKGIANWKTGLKVNYPVTIKWKAAGSSKMNVAQFERIYPVEKGVQSIDEGGELIILYKNKELSLLWYNDSSFASIEEINTLHTQSKNPIAINKLSPRALQTAIINNDIAKVKEFMEKGFGLEEYLPNQATPLYTAAAVRKTEIALYLLELGANPNAKIKSNGRNALMLALTNGTEELARKLIEKGADIKVLDDGGHNMLHYAVAGKLMKMFPLLIEGGLSLNTKFKKGMNLLMFASKIGNTQCVKDLVEKWGFNVNAADDDGRTVLMYACLWGQKETIECLIKAGANLDAQDKYKVKAVYMLTDIMQMEGRKELIPLIKKMVKLNNNEKDNELFKKLLKTK